MATNYEHYRAVTRYSTLAIRVDQCKSTFLHKFIKEFHTRINNKNSKSFGKKRCFIVMDSVKEDCHLVIDSRHRSTQLSQTYFRVDLRAGKYHITDVRPQPLAIDSIDFEVRQ